MAEQKENPFDYGARVLAAMKTAARWLDATTATGEAVKDLREAVALMHTELTRLRAIEFSTTRPQAVEPSEERPPRGKVMGLFHRLRAQLEVDGDASWVMEQHRAAFERLNRELTAVTELEPLDLITQGLSFSFDGSSAYVDVARANPEVFSELDVVGLRVMAAHLATALDNVTKALNSKGVFN
jgi:hypothetical protein